MAQNALFLLKKAGINLLVGLLTGLIHFKNFLVFLLTWTVAKPLWWLGKTVLFSLAVKIYKLCLFLKIRWDKIYAPIKKKFIYPLTRRYVTHSVIALISIFSIATNINAKDKPLETIDQIGEDSILFALAQNNNSEDYYIEEGAQTSGAKVLSYLGPDAGMALPANISDNSAGNLSLAEIGEDSVFLNPNLPATSLNLNPRTKIVEYIVQEGDVVSTIAENFGLKINTLLWANKLSANDMIRPGDKLLILPTDGVLHQVKKTDNLSKIAKYYNADAEKIQEFNALFDEKDLIVGEYLIIPEGKVPSPPAPAPKPVSRLADRRVFKIPPSRNSSGAGMLWPTPGKVITQYFTWRHSGLDIDGDMTSPIYAAEAGTVKYVGWGRGYGNQIVISHGNGVETRYAHLSKFIASQGDTVTKGQAIGIMGSTGWSTGPHLHFEVMIGGKRVNPLNYL
jgi:murein DD-endopeptidase MepM/ murein hydrolase activator NlpD